MDVTGNLDNTLGTQEARQQFRNEYHSFVLKQCQRQCTRPEMVEDLADYVILKTEHQYRNKPLPYRCEAYLVSQVCLAYARYADNPEALSSVVGRNRPVYDQPRREDPGREKTAEATPWQGQAGEPAKVDSRGPEPSVTADVQVPQMQRDPAAETREGRIPGSVRRQADVGKASAQMQERSSFGSPVPAEVPRQEVSSSAKKPWWEAPEWNSAPAMAPQGQAPYAGPGPVQTPRQEETAQTKEPWWETPEWNSAPAAVPQRPVRRRTSLTTEASRQEVPGADAACEKGASANMPLWEAPEWNAAPAATPQRASRRRHSVQEQAPMQEAPVTVGVQEQAPLQEAPVTVGVQEQAPLQEAPVTVGVQAQAPLREVPPVEGAQVQFPEGAGRQEAPTAMQPQPEEMQMDAAPVEAPAEMIPQEAAGKEAAQAAPEVKMDAVSEGGGRGDAPSLMAEPAAPVQAEPLVREPAAGQMGMTPETLAAAVAAAVVQALGRSAPPAVEARSQEIPAGRNAEGPALPLRENGAPPESAATKPGETAAPAAPKPEQKAKTVVMEAILDENDTELWTPDSQKETTVQHVKLIRNQAPPEEKRLIPLTLLNMVLGIGSVAAVIFLLMCLDILPRVF